MTMFNALVVEKLIKKIKERGEKLLQKDVECSDAVVYLKEEFEFSDRKIKDRDSEIALLKTQIEGFKAALEMANAKAIAPNIQHFADVVDSVVNDKLIEKIEERDRKIEILEDNLNRARSEHLEQLRAIVQMLEPLVSNQIGCINAVANNSLLLAIAVIQNNIAKLDPNLTDR